MKRSRECFARRFMHIAIEGMIMKPVLEERDARPRPGKKKSPVRTDVRPRVSIGIPVYNGERYIAGTIDSILAQTFRDFELIISDNASTDGTSTICRRYAAADERVRYFRNERNLGAAKNFNLLFTHARGEYFKWAAADNLIEPTFLERCVEVLDARPDAVVAYTKCKQINDFDGTMRTIDTDRDLESADACERLHNLFLQVIGMQDTIWGLMRVSALQKTRLIRSFVGADDCLLIELILQGPYVEVPEHLLVLRIHPGGY
ncbi:MAG: glycosyltransferase family 2 protein, partial [Candidatus Krumholzibacteria bacterium]|nr:glycosyltransferase family 2 protein [Candidatus Krumholzibacteria bacterium]